jgi:uncharacterized protein YebE (UPF0316 family)
MVIELNIFILLTGVAIFFARIIDVSLGTLRTISIVHGRKWLAFWLGFFEIIIWLTVISTVIHKIKEVPILGIFYAFGFAAGNLVGIKVENWLAFGCINLRVISRKHHQEMSKSIREAGYAVTTFQGEGKTGPVVELYVACRRRNLKELLEIVHQFEPDVFYTTEHAASVSKVYGPIFQPVTGWRSILKKK